MPYYEAPYGAAPGGELEGGLHCQRYSPTSGHSGLYHSRKHDTAVDLAMAVAVLAANCAVPAHAAAGVMYYAGLGGDGRLAPVPGVLPAAVEAAKAGCRALVVAAENTAEARLVPGVTAIGASRLAEVAGWLCGGPAPPGVRTPGRCPAARSAGGGLRDTAR